MRTLQTKKPGWFIQALLWVALGCGDGGSPQKSASSDPASFSDVRGSIGSQSGSQSAMAGWVIALVEREGGVLRVAEIDTAGIFTFKHVFLGRVYTLVLLSPSYVLRAVLAQPAGDGKVLAQYFTLAKPSLPRLTHKGPVMGIQTDSDIQFTSETVPDADGNGIPDTLTDLQLTGLPAPAGPAWALETPDTDRDGIPNAKDADIDGDGLPNAFDADDDGDGVLDVFDPDANGDTVLDHQQEVGDLYASEGAKWVIVKYEMTPHKDGTFQRSLSFTTQVRKNEGVLPSHVQIRGSSSLLAGAQMEVSDANGATVTQTWDRLLLDDGFNEDSAADDGLYARRVILEPGRAPVSNQVIFFQLAYGTASDAWYREFAYTFPALRQTAITASCDPLTRIVTLQGDPFGDVQDFLWIINVYQDTATKPVRVYSSPSIQGEQRSYALPDNVLEAGQTYQFKVSAQVLDRIAGYPSHLIESELSALPGLP